jgi:hypothetical protein
MLPGIGEDSMPPAALRDGSRVVTLPFRQLVPGPGRRRRNGRRESLHWSCSAAPLQLPELKALDSIGLVEADG